MRLRILSSLVIFSMVLGACAPKKNKKESTAQPAKPYSPETPAVKCATKDDTSLAPERKIQRQTIELKMEKQRVIRKDCEGRVTSDQMEKVTTPTKEILLKPVGWWIGQSFALPQNRTTCTGPGLELERLFWAMFGIGLVSAAGDVTRHNAGFPSARFTVDTSPTVSAMHVKKNADNYIDYDFQKCVEKAADGSCAKQQSLEKGTLILTVKYSENLNIGGIKEVPGIDCEPKN